MNKLIFGFDQFKEDGDPLPNLENFEFDNKKICSWNAMMVIALMDSAVAYKNTKWKNKGEKLLSDMVDLFLYESTCYRSRWKRAC